MASIILQRTVRLAFTFTVNVNPRPMVFFINFPRRLLFSLSSDLPLPKFYRTSTYEHADVLQHSIRIIFAYPLSLFYFSIS
jgi:hypothetical protein